MDLNASAPYEFLDLSDIDDSERKQLIRTLYKSSQEEEPSLISTKIKKKSVHGTTSYSTTIKDVHKYSRYDSSKYVKNVAVYNLPQQITTNVRLHAEQNKTKGTLKPCVNSLSSMMAQHTPALHHQPQQQQLVSQQGQAQSHQQTQQNPSQNNNLSNYTGPLPTQPHGFNPIQHGNNMYIQPHGVGGTTYMLPAPPPLSNVYVNNVTANVTMTGFVAHSGSQYLSGAAPPFIPSEHLNMPHVTEQATCAAPQTTIVSNTRTTRRGRGRTNNGTGRRNEFHQRQQQSSPSPQEIINPPVDTQNLGGSGYPQFIQFAYPAPMYGTPQNIGPPQAQQATGAPLFLNSPVQIFPQYYHYSPVIFPQGLPSDYPLLDEKDEEQQHPEGMIPHMWSGHMPMEYTEEYINHDMNADVNHNPSSITSSDTPSLLSPNYPIFEQPIPPLEMQQQLSSMHIYDTQSLPPQTGLQSEEQHMQECQSLQTLSSDQMGPPLIFQAPNPAEQLQHEHDLQEQAVDIVNTTNNNDPILTEVPCAALITERNIPDISYVNNQSLSTQQPTSINTSMTNITNMPIVNNNEINVLKDVNENVPNVQPQQPEKVSVTTNKIENENFSVPNINSDIPINSTNRPMQWTNQQKKSTASVAVTATPSLTSKQNSKYNTNQNISTPQCPQVKNYGAMKTPSSPVITNDAIPERRISQTSHSVESGKPISTASIASTIAPQQFQDNNLIDSKNMDSNVAYAVAPNKEQVKTDTENIVRTKKDEATSTSMVPPVSQTPASIAQPPQQQGPLSWASLFSNKSSVSSSTIISNVPSVSKKPIAKVSPFEGTSNFVPPSTPGGMSYSAASAQGISSAQSNVNAKIKSPSSSIASNFSKENVDEWSIKFADFLTKYNVDYSSVSLRPRGLTNRSNYCYINAILQAFVGCPPFYNLIKAIPKQIPGMNNERTNIPTINAMMQLIAEFSHLPPGARLLSRREKGQKKDDMSGELQCDAAFEPTAIYKLWNSTRADVEGRQEDAEEFLGYVLNKLNDEMLEIIKLTAKPSVEQQQQQNGDTNDGDDAEEWQMIYNNRNKGSVTRQTDFGRTPISDIFRGELRSRIQREGEHSTDVIQPFFTLQLNIEKAASVKEALEILVGRDQLEGVTCSKTNQEVVAWQQMNLEKLPVVLILHLKWFDYKLDGCTKILKTVDFPVELKVDTKILASKKYSQKQRLYRLFAVVYHDGKQASKGHYITDVFHPGYLNWLRFDDSSVKPVSENNVLRPRAPRVPYLLYYRRSDTAPAHQQQQQQQQQPHNATNSK